MCVCVNSLEIFDMEGFGKLVDSFHINWACCHRMDDRDQFSRLDVSSVFLLLIQLKKIMLSFITYFLKKILQQAKLYETISNVSSVVATVSLNAVSALITWADTVVLRQGHRTAVGVCGSAVNRPRETACQLIPAETDMLTLNMITNQSIK